MNNILITRLENQIEKMFDTFIKIWEEEQQVPMRELSDWHKTTLWMMFFGQVLMKSCWNNIFNVKRLKQEDALKYIKEAWEMTKEHYKNLYGFDSIEIANNWLNKNKWS